MFFLFSSCHRGIQKVDSKSISYTGDSVGLCAGEIVGRKRREKLVQSLNLFLTVSAVMGRLMLFGSICLDFRGPCLKAVTDKGKKHYRRNQCSLPILVVPPKI